MCPRANTLLAELDTHEDVIPLALSVDIFDALGWADTFAQPAFSQRQEAYGQMVDVRFAYTPQMVIQGLDDVRGSRPRAVSRVLDAHRSAAGGAPTVALSWVEGRPQETLDVAVTPADAAEGASETPADIWLMSFTPGTVTVHVKGGDNAGERVPVHNAVRELRHLGVWTGTPLRVRAEALAAPAAAVLVQEPGPGRILASAILTGSEVGVEAPPH